MIEPQFDLDDVLQISNNRNKEDTLKINSNATDLNNAGMKTFEINNQQHYINLSDSYLFGEFSITKKDGSVIAATDDITLENNWFPRCFSQFILNVGGKEIEGIHTSVGEASTLANLIMTSEIYKNTYGQLSGWFPDTGKANSEITGKDFNSGYYNRKRIYNNKNKFTAIFPLKYLFGFTEYTKILYLIKISLNLNRRSDVELCEDIFYGKEAGKISFTNLEWRIPTIEPSLEIEEIITKRLNTQKSIDVVFMKRNMNKLTIATGAKQTWKIGSYTNAVRFVFVAFKETTAPSALINNALFVGDKITSLRLQLNSMYYPIDSMTFNFDDYNIVEPYLAYINCCKTFGNEPQLTLQEFHDIYPIFVFDCSAQPETLKSNGIDISLHIEKTSTLTLEGYALILEDSYYNIQTNNGRMLRIS